MDSSNSQQINALLEKLSTDIRDNQNLMDQIQTELEYLFDQLDEGKVDYKDEYKLFEAQALLFFLQGDSDKAKQYMDKAVDLNGTVFKNAQDFYRTLNEQRPKKSLTKWILLIVLPWVLLIMVAILQIIANFAFSQVSAQDIISEESLVTTMNTAEQTNSGDVIKLIFNVLSFLAGTVAVILIFLTPIWIIKIIDTIEYNDLKPKSKTIAIVLAVLFGFFAWIYTYKNDSTKFWINLVLACLTLSLWSLVAWIWTIVDMANKDTDFFTAYNYS